MGLINGAIDVMKGALGLATSPARTALGVAGTSLSTGANVVGNLASGNVGGAFSSVADGVRQQVGNVTGYFTENLDSVRDIAGGHAEFLQGGINLLGVPARAEQRTGV